MRPVDVRQALLKNHTIRVAAVGTRAAFWRLRRWASVFRPVRPMAGSQGRLDAEYARGVWSYLHEADELARFSVVVGYCHHLKPGGWILELGCGNGILAERLDHARLAGYLGVDVSGTAIAAAAHLKSDDVDFVAADALSYRPPRRFDVIVFNEVLEYFEDPAGLVRRYESWLTADGVIVFSMFVGIDTTRDARIWRALHRSFTQRDRTKVVNRRGFRWTIEVLEPRR